MAKPEHIHYVRHLGPSNMDEVRIVESEFVSACQRLMCEENHEEITRAMVDVKDWMQWMYHRRVILKEETRHPMLEPPWLVKYRLQKDGLIPYCYPGPSPQPYRDESSLGDGDSGDE